ncbi:MAG TPA: (Fe-S)-binding protein [Acidimicrobiales bacterium]|nr:(Fe-S)-binding protein [Acidimicrobiales bacterium]
MTGTAVLFPTCVVDGVRPQVGVATVRLLRARGFRVELARSTTCCGQPAWNAGQVDAAARVARTTLAGLEEAGGDVVVVPAGSCATMIRRFWPELFRLAGEPGAAERAEALGQRVRELSELLAGLPAGLPAAGAAPGQADRGPGQAASAGPVVYHRSCHMLRELGIAEAPEQVLDGAGVERVANPTAGTCCGFGGLFAVKLPEASVAMADHVLDGCVASGAATVVGCDASCLLQLEGRARRRRLPLAFRHLAEVLAPE